VDEHDHHGDNEKDDDHKDSDQAAALPALTGLLEQCSSRAAVSERLDFG
jgi:hypothetical protein